jgi:hypothetical protein
MLCNHASQRLFWGSGTYRCTREQRHMGEHQARITVPYEGYVQWSTDGGGSMWAAEDPHHPEWKVIACEHCGIMFKPDAYGSTKGGTHCFHCVFWAGRMAQYANGELMVIDGTVYSWGAEHGYGGREFTITTEDGQTITNRGLWNGGVIPWEYRLAMPDNAAFGHRFARQEMDMPRPYVEAPLTTAIREVAHWDSVIERYSKGEHPLASLAVTVAHSLRDEWQTKVEELQQKEGH